MTDHDFKFKAPTPIYRIKGEIKWSDGQASKIDRPATEDEINHINQMWKDFDDNHSQNPNHDSENET